MAVDLEKYKKATTTPSVNLEKYKKQPAPMPEKGPGFLQSVAQDIANPFLRVGASAANTVRGLGTIGTAFKDPQKAASDLERIRNTQYDFGWLGKARQVGGSGNIVEDAKDAGSQALQIGATIIPAGKLPTLAKTTIGGLVKQGAIQGAKTGAKSGFLYGAGKGLEEKDATVGSVLTNAAMNAGLGSLGGGVVGGTLAAPVGTAQAVQKRFFPTAQQATDKLKGAYDEVFGATKSGTNKLEKSLSTGKNPSQFLAENGIVIDVTPDNKINTKGAREFLSTKMDTMDDELTTGLRDLNRTVSLDDVEAEALKAVDNAKTRADATVVDRQAQVKEIFAKYRQIYGNDVPLDILNEMKRGQRSLTNVFDASKPRFATDVHYQTSKVLMNKIEKAAPELNVGEFNKNYGDHIDASKLLKSINGQAVKGGKLGKYFSQAAGSIVGSTVGSSMGPLGTVGGAVAGDFVGGALQSKTARNAVLPPMVKKALEKGKIGYQPNVLRKNQAIKLPTAAPNNIDNIPTKLPSKGNPSSKLPTQNFAGGFAGIEKDEEGNLNFSGEKALAGMLGGAAIARSKVGQELSKSIDGLAKKAINRFHPDDINVMEQYIDSVRTGTNLPRRIEEQAYKLMERWKINPDGDANKIADKFEKALRGEIKLKATNLPGRNFTGEKKWNGTTSSKPSTGTSIPTVKKPTGKEGAYGRSVNTSAGFDSFETGGWSRLQEQNPDLFNKGILRRQHSPMGAQGDIPAEVHAIQHKWQHLGQNSDIPADEVYERVNSGSFKGDYVDKEGFPIYDSNGEVVRDTFNPETGEWVKPYVSNEVLRNQLLDAFSTPDGKKYLQEVVKALPKNKDGSITAYRVGGIGDGPQSYTLSEQMAKTFSNQGADVLPAGMPGLPTQGYKDWGSMPANVVKIDPKGIVAWVPYDSEILVEKKHVLDIWKPKKK